MGGSGAGRARRRGVDASQLLVLLPALIFLVVAGREAPQTQDAPTPRPHVLDRDMSFAHAALNGDCGRIGGRVGALVHGRPIGASGVKV